MCENYCCSFWFICLIEVEEKVTNYTYIKKNGNFIQFSWSETTRFLRIIKITIVIVSSFLRTECCFHLFNKTLTFLVQFLWFSSIITKAFSSSSSFSAFVSTFFWFHYTIIKLFWCFKLCMFIIRKLKISTACEKFW